MQTKSHGREKVGKRQSALPAKRKRKPLYEPRIRFERLDAMQRAIYEAVSTGKHLDEAKLVEVGQALAFLHNLLFRDWEKHRLGRRLAEKVWCAAYIIHVLHDEHGASVKEAALCSMPRVTKEQALTMERAYRKLKARSGPGAVIVNRNLIEEAVARLKKRESGKN